MKLFFKCLAKYFLSNIIVSVVLAFLVAQGFIPGTRLWAAIIVVLANALILIYLNKTISTFMYSPENRSVFFKIYIPVFLLFFITCFILSFFKIEPIYTFLFLPYKLLYVIDISKPISAFVVNMIMLLFLIGTYIFVKKEIESFEGGYEYDIWKNV